MVMQLLVLQAHVCLERKGHGDQEALVNSAAPCGPCLGRAGPDRAGYRACVPCLSDQHTLPWEKLWAGCGGRADLQAGSPGQGGPAEGGGGGGAEIVSRGRPALDSGGQVKGRSTEAPRAEEMAKEERCWESGESPQAEETTDAKAQRQEQVGVQPLGTPPPVPAHLPLVGAASL